MSKVRFMLILVGLSAAFSAGGADPFAGTWRFNPHKSKYAGGPPPKDMLIRIQTTPNGISYRSETTQANGRRTEASYMADYSGMETIVTGTLGLMAPVSLHRVDDRTILASYKRGMQVVAESRYVVSQKARILTIVTTSIGSDGRNVTNVGVYEKASPMGHASIADHD